MKTYVLPVALAAGLLGSAPLHAQEGPWMVRLRAVALQPADKSDAAPGIPADAIHVSSKTIPEVDISYFFTKNLAAELVLTVPQEHDVTLAGTKIGTFKELPPTLTAQWHFLPGQTVDPYVGLGLNLTLISDVKLAGGALDLDKSSVGPAAQAGVDFKVAKQCFINLDVKYVQLRSDVKAGGTKVTTVKVDPMLYGVGVGYRF
ncbi:outer membrane protein [Geothrix rubra]|uniref:Outer membrane protein n=1 Tax=Geothrix rubra TaxID=2927977 RepID=A0ABQ5Q8Q2_9BACT|nr:OmpW family outer membrane protein [Geothrix rubra]GLH70909.1 outer membrane protein [Geothrix rubra]